MKIKSITYSMTRQVTNFHPASFEISADVLEGENEQEVARELQRLTIRILYKDRPIERDSLIKQLCDSDNKTKIAINKTKDEENDFPDFAP